MARPLPGVSEPTTEHATPSRQRLDYVDGLRALAALSVMAFHIHAGFYSDLYHKAFWTCKLADAGHFGVPVFLVVSGFCLALPFAQRRRDRVNIRSFAIRRSLRILPPYFIVLTVVLILYRLPFLVRLEHNPAPGTEEAILHYLMLHNLFAAHMYSISGPFWSLALEWQLYVLFPLLMRLISRPRLLLGIAFAVFAVWAVLTPFVDLHRSTPALSNVARDAWLKSLPAYLPLFAGGMVAAAAVASSRRLPRCFGLVALVLLGCSVASDEYMHLNPIIPDLSAGLAAAMVLVLVPESLSHRILSCRVLTAIGATSYTLYLVHGEIVLFLSRLAPPSACLLHHSIAVLAAVVSVVGCLYLARVIELPFHRLARRLAPTI